ncbi:uncharacterized protein LOC111012809 [Momordica charantia]|uniref:Uncharacterized protein LOC111012809 n=1 Tax=Momordica charantia TaxID=3673 RepID=A0A6J1CLV9_MOMCH|nr:uncharacterized protein LOC111012809 [Momordica charantia]
MSPIIACDVLSMATSRDVWKALEDLYETANKARINQLKTSLQTTRKNQLKMSDYLSTMKQLADCLTLAGEPISTSSLLSSVLTGLNAEYLQIICQINAKENISWQEVHATLITFENILIHLNNVSIADVSGPSANYTYNKSVSQNWNPHQQGQGRGQGRNSRGRNRGGRFQGQRSNSSRPTCQVCGKIGHLAVVCYHRLNMQYMGNTPQGGNQAPNAYITGPEVIIDPNWLIDSGATNHKTNDATNLGQQAEYQGNENLTVGNRYKLAIAHVGSTVICQKETMDKETGRIMLEGKLNQGLYQLDLLKPKRSKFIQNKRAMQSTHHVAQVNSECQSSSPQVHLMKV